MIKKLLLLIATLFPVLAGATTTQIIGTLTSNSGPVNGKLCVRLPVNSIDTSTNKALSPVGTCWPMANGQLPTFAGVVPNDVIQPQNTYYQVRAYDRTNALVYFANWVVPTGGGTFDMGQAIPTTITTTNISYLNPALLNVSQTWTATQIFPTNSIDVNELVNGANETCLETLGGIVQWLACSTGTAVSVNGSAVGASVNFGNLPAAGANNILGVWQFSAGNASVEIPITGNGGKVLSGTGTYNNGHGLVIDANGNVVDSGQTGVFIQRVSKCQTTPTCTVNAAPCTTTSSSYDVCTDTLTWPVAFSDNNYDPVPSCKDSNIIGGGTSDAVVVNIQSHTASQVVVVTQTQRSNTAHCEEIHVIAAR